MEVPTWGAGNSGLSLCVVQIEASTFDRNQRYNRNGRGDRGDESRDWNSFRQVGSGQRGESQGGDGMDRGDRFRFSTRNSTSTQVRALAPTGTAPADVERKITNRVDYH